VGVYFWDNPTSPIPNDNYTITIPGWPGVGSDEWFLFSTWIALTTTDGKTGFAEGPLQVAGQDLVPLFDPTSGEVHMIGMTGARLIVAATIFKVPGASPGLRVNPGPGFVIAPGDR
jgi:hypothetical protein